MHCCGGSHTHPKRRSRSGFLASKLYTFHVNFVKNFRSAGFREPFHTKTTIFWKNRGQKFSHCNFFTVHPKKNPTFYSACHIKIRPFLEGPTEIFVNGQLRSGLDLYSFTASDGTFYTNFPPSPTSLVPKVGTTARFLLSHTTCSALCGLPPTPRHGRPTALQLPR